MDINATALAASTYPETTHTVTPKAAVAEETVETSGSTAAVTGAAIYVSPVIRFDQLARTAVLYFRDAETGDTRDQIPPQKVVEEYRRNGGRDRSEEPMPSTEKQSASDIAAVAAVSAAPREQAGGTAAGSDDSGNSPAAGSSTAPVVSVTV